MALPPQDLSSNPAPAIPANSVEERASDGAQQALKQLSDCIPGVVYQYLRGQDGQISAPYISPSCYAVFGLTAETIQSDPYQLTRLIHPEDFPSYVESVDISAQTLSPWQWTGRFILACGQVKWIQGAAQPRWIGEGEILWDGVLMDVTQSKQTELALRYHLEFEALISRISTHFIRLTSETLQAGIDWALGEIAQFAGFDRSFIVLFSEDGQWGEMFSEWWTSDLDPLPPEWHRIPAQPFAWWMDQIRQLKTIEIVRLQEMPAAAKTERWAIASVGTRSLVCVPIAYEDQPLGYIGFAAVKQEKCFATTTLDLLRLVGELFANALHRYRTSHLQQSLDTEATLKRILIKIRDSLDEDQILQSAVEELGQAITDIESCNLALYNETLTQSTICFEFPPTSTRETLIDLSDSPDIYTPLLQGHTVHYCRLPTANVWSHKYKRTQLAVSIQHSLDPLGDLWLIKPEGHIFTDVEVSLVEQIAAQCAIAIRQARLYQAAQTQVEELAKLNQLKDDFLSTVSHELRTPLTNMRMAIKMLTLNPSPEKYQHYLTVLEQDCRRENELINDLLSLQRLEAKRYDFFWETIDINSLIESLREPFLLRAQQEQIHLEFQLPLSSPSLTTDRSGLERIVQELLNNACKYTQAQGTIRLQVHCLPQQVVLTVGNTATLPTKEIPKIFEKFYRSTSADHRRKGGTGLGLPLIKELLEQMQGQIQVTCEPGWVQFRIELPLVPTSPLLADESQVPPT